MTVQALSRAEISKHYREREKQGLCCLTVEVDEVKAAQALITAGLLDEKDEDDRQKLSLALGALIRAICEGDLNNISLRVTGNDIGF